MVLTGDEHAEHLPIHIHFVDLACGAVAGEQILWSRIRDAKIPRSTDARDGLFKVQIVVINLDTPVPSVGHIDIVLTVCGDAMRGAELILIMTPGP